MNTTNGDHNNSNSDDEDDNDEDGVHITTGRDDNNNDDGNRLGQSPEKVYLLVLLPEEGTKTDQECKKSTPWTVRDYCIYRDR